MGNTPAPPLQQDPTQLQKMTPMLSPNGSPGEIPVGKVPDALKAGFKIGAKLTSPSGKTGVVPLDRVHEAFKAGFTPFVESEQTANPVAPIPMPYANQKVMGGTFQSPLANTQANQEPLGAPVAPLLGASVGQVVRGVAGGLAGSYGGSKLGEYIGEKTKLSPAETIWASRIGSTLGAFAGAGAGGSSQAESIWSGIKNSFANKLYTTEGELSGIAESILHPTKMPENAIRAIFPKPEDIPGGVAPTSPSSAEFYENRAADLVKRGKEQAALDKAEGVKARAAARDASKYYTPSSEAQSTTPAAVSNLPASSGPSEAPAGGSPTTSTGPAVTMNVRGMPKPAKSLIVSPDSEPAPIKGSFWSYPQAALKDAVMAGDREAAVVYRMRFNELPPGAKYLNDVSEAVIKGLYKSSK